MILPSEEVRRDSRTSYYFECSVSRGGPVPRVGCGAGSGSHYGPFGKKRDFCATEEPVSSSLKSARPGTASRAAGPGRHGGAPGPVADPDPGPTSRNPAETEATRGLRRV